MIIKRDDAFRTVCEFRTEVNSGKFNVGTGMFVSSQADDNNTYGCGDNISVPRDVYDYLQDKAKKVPCPNCWKKGLIKNEDIQVNDKYYNQMLWEYSEEIIKRWDAIFGEV